MFNRSQHLRPFCTSDRKRLAFHIHQDDIHDDTFSSSAPPDDSPPRPTLAAASFGAMNARSTPKGSYEVPQSSKALPSFQSPPTIGQGSPRRMGSTIRAVQTQDEGDQVSFRDDAHVGRPSSTSRHPTAALCSSQDGSESTEVASSRQDSHANGGDPRSNVRLRPRNPAAAQRDGPPRTPSPVDGTGVDVPRRESSLGVTTRLGLKQPAGVASSNGIVKTVGHDGQYTENISLGATEAQLSSAWDSTVGKAALSGKTGRVINRLVSDNEVLKRDIKIEKLKAEEFRQAARLIEDKMDRTVAEYESRLLEASVTKALLSRKERQVESLLAAVELEKKRTLDAQEKERTWREEMERVRSESKRHVEQATTHAALMEGRYNAISSHWKEQGDEVNRALQNMRKEVAELLEERARDDDRINTLRELCDQQDGNIRNLRRQNQDITKKFDEYRAEQEEALRDIKAKAAQREAEQVRTLEETKQVLHKLRWALKVKENVREAQ